MNGHTGAQVARRSRAARPSLPRGLRLAALPLMVACAFQVAPAAAQVAGTALPTGGAIAAGQGKLLQSGSNLTVQQLSNRLITNWQSFNIGKDASVVFAQPNAQAIALNRVLAGDASQILGSLRANGQVFLLNPQGVVFGSSARVDVGGLMASSMAMSDADFLAGRNRLVAGPGAGVVSNAGEINANWVALVAPTVVNSGVITAANGTQGGQVALAAGSAATLQLDAAGLISVQVDPATAASVTNSGNIIADGGRIWMTANQAAPAAASAINQTGTLRANSLVARNGEIYLDGGRGSVQVAGTVQAKGLEAGSTGGRIVATGDSVAVSGKVDASGQAGGGTVLLGGGYQGKDTSVANARELTMAASADVRADATGTGTGGTVVLWSDEHTRLGGALSARGQERGGFIETSSKGLLDIAGTVNVGAESGIGGRWLIDPTYTTIGATEATTLGGMLNAGGTTDVDSATFITISADINKTSGADAVLNFRAGGNITLDSGKAISSVSGKMDVNFCGTTCGSTASGTVDIGGQISTNGGSVTFYKATTLSAAAPISTKLLGSGAGTSGNVTFHQDVTLKAPLLAVTISTQGPQAGATYVGNGGAVDFKGKIVSGLRAGDAAEIPQALTIDTTGIVPGAITLRDSVGTVAHPLSKLTLTGPTSISLDGAEINIKSTSGDVIVASSTLGTPKLILGAATTDIRVTGGNVNGVAGYADYKQDTFDIGVKDSTVDRVLNITADRSIKIKNRTIDGETNASGKKLDINLKPYNAAAATGTLAVGGGSIQLDTVTMKSNGGFINFGGPLATDYAVGYGSDIDGITDGIRIFNSTIDSKNGAITLRGKAPLTTEGGAGVKVYGLSTVNAGTGGLTIDGKVEQISVSGNKDAVIIGEGSTSVTSLLTSGSGAINITGDASSIGTAASAGSRYNGVQISSGAVIQSAAGAINITGKGGGGNDNVSDRNNGIEMESLNTAILSTSGDITLTGVSGGKSGSFGLFGKANSMYIGAKGASTASGIITLIADSMQFINTSSQRLQVASTGELRIRPITTNRNIELGTAGQDDRLALGSSWFSGSNAVFQPGFVDITIGQAGLAGGVVESTGTLSVAGATTVRDPLNLRMFGTGGAVALSSPLTVKGASNENRTLSIQVKNGASSTTGGLITVDKLHLIGSGDFSLIASNLINTVAGDSSDNVGHTGIDGKITVKNAQALSIDTANSVSLGVTSPTAVGLKTANNQDISVSTSVGDLSVKQNVDAGTGVVSLGATAGAVNETGTAIVKAGKLAVTAQNTSSLNNVNQVGTLAASTTGGTTADLTFIAQNGVVVDTVAGVTGVSVGGTAWIQAQNGSITQLSPFAANKAALRATGDIDLSLTSSGNAVNSIGTIAAKTDNGIVHVVNNGALVVGSASTTAGTATSGTGGVLTGIDTSAGNKGVRLKTDVGNITLNNDINAGTGTVSLIATAGAVNETGTISSPASSLPIITAGKLAVTALNTSSLANDNAVATFAANITGSAKDLTFVGKDAIVIDQITDLANTTVTGLTVPGSAWLQAKNGSITQTQKVSAGSLAAKATGDIALDLAPSTNTIGTLAAASTGGTVSVLNNASIHVGTVTTASATATLGGPLIGVVTTNKDVTIRTTTDGITLASPITAGSATVSLESAAGINQTTGEITTANLRVLATGNVSLESATNNVTTLAASMASPGGSFAYRDADALTIGSVAVTLGGGAGTTSGIDTSVGNGEQYIRTGGDLTIAQDVKAGTGIVSYESAGTVGQTGGAITADKLRIISAGTIDAQQSGNNVAVFAATITGGSGSVAYRDADALQIGSITGTLGQGVKTTTGVDSSASNGEQYIRTGGALTITENVKAGTGIVSYESASSITQSGGAITADKLRIIAAGNVDVQQSGNNVGTIAAAVSGGSLAYRDSNDLQVGTITGTLGVSTKTTTGVDTATGNGEQYIRTGGLLTLTQNVNAGTGIVSLESGNGISQTGGTVTADKLRITSTGNVDMQQSGNNVGTLAAQVGNGSLAYRDTDALQVGTVTGTLGLSALTTSGVDTATGNGEQYIRTGGALTLTQNVAAGTGLVSFESDAAITQTAGAITADGLRVIAAGNVDLQTQTNNVNTLAATIGAPGGSLAYRDTNTLTLGSLTGTLGSGVKTTTGVDTAAGNGEQYIRTGAALTVAQDVKAGTGLVSFESGGGITQSGGAITASGLRVIANGNVDIQQASNNVATLAAAATGGSVAYRDSDALQVDSLTGTLGSGVKTTSGVDTATGNGEQYIRTGGALGLSQNLAAGSGIVSLESAAGINQTAGAVTADKLRVLAAANVSLQQSGNTVNTVAAQLSAGSVALANSTALKVDAVTGTLGSSVKTTTGLDTSAGNGEQYVKTGGALSLANDVKAGTGLVSFESAAGISQSGSTVAANGLRMIAAGNVDLQQANTVNTVAAKVSNGSVAFNNNQALSVGSLTGTLGSGVMTTSGVDTATGNGEQYIRTAGALSLAQNVAAGSGIVSFESAAGVSQSAGALTAGQLRVLAANAVDLQQSGNNVTTIAAKSTSGAVSYRDADALTVGSVTGTLGSGVKTTSGVDTTGGNAAQILRTGGLLSLTQNVAAGAGAVVLNADGGVAQSAGALTADKLTVIAGGNVDLTQSGNNVTTLAGKVTGGGGFLYKDADSLVIASIGGIDGLQAQGPINVRAMTDLTLQSPVVGTAAVRNAVVLSAVNKFQNNAGPNAVSAPNGRWLIYDDNPFLDLSRLGGINYDFLKTGVLYDGYPPADVIEQGTGYLTTVRPPPPETFARPVGGMTQPNASGNVSANSSATSGYGSISGVTIAKYSIDTGSPNVVIDGLGGSGKRFEAGVGIRVEVQPRQRFVADLSGFLGEGLVDAVTLADGSALPPWLGFDGATKRFSGFVPADAPASVKVKVKVRGSNGQPRDVDVEIAVAR